MAYTKQTWENLPSQTTPINADRLTHIEDGIFNAAATADTAASNASSAISGLADKVDKVEGKGLSTNDFTDALKTKLDNVEAGAEVNVQSDWNQSDNSADDYIKNKPSLGTASAKNSTSVVTDSSDLVESGAVYTALQGKADNSVIGTVEGANASKAWSAGEHFIKDGQFKEVTAPIASGEAIDSGNTTDKPIAELLDYEIYTDTFTFGGVTCSYTIQRVGRNISLSIDITNATFTNGSSSLFTLPSAYRPSINNRIFAGIGRDAGTWATASYFNFALRVNTDGIVAIVGNNIATMKYVSLSVEFII